jgi:hypothetical protein
VVESAGELQVGQLPMTLSVSTLVGLRMWGLAHAGDMPTLQVGERKASTSPLGHDRTTGEYALHIQCSWALTFSGRRYESAHDFDAARNALGSAIAREPRIADVQEDTRGNLRLEFDGDIVLELVSADCPADEEAWRLFRPGDHGPHLVRYGDGSRRE